MRRLSCCGDNKGERTKDGNEDREPHVGGVDGDVDRKCENIRAQKLRR